MAGTRQVILYKSCQDCDWEPLRIGLVAREVKAQLKKENLRVVLVDAERDTSRIALQSHKGWALVYGLKFPDGAVWYADKGWVGEEQ